LSCDLGFLFFRFFLSSLFPALLFLLLDLALLDLLFQGPEPSLRGFAFFSKIVFLPLRFVPRQALSAL